MINSRINDLYNVGFDGGYQFQLVDRPGTFRVSQAGIALGNHLVAHLGGNDLSGRILDAGTGSGAIALLLRGLGASSVAATDICRSAVATARQNESLNYGDHTIDFCHSDLFPARVNGQNERFDLIVFNPPGWRTPPEGLVQGLGSHARDLELDAMFYGDRVLLRFLHLLPDHLAEGGRVIVGLNSLIGIADIISRARANSQSNDSMIVPRLLERFEFPLMFYTEEWQNVRAGLLTEFARGREEYAATYVTEGESIRWFYEITEITLHSVPASVVGEESGAPVTGASSRAAQARLAG